jgi:GT2 family glycosyltransferase
MIRTAIVLINYLKEQELIQFVDEYLRPQLSAGRQLIVVDNGSDGITLQKALTELDHVKVLMPGSNLGYFGASRHALEYLQKTSGLPEFFIISNFDLEFDSHRFLDELEAVCNSADAAVIGPHIVSSLSGAALNPMYAERLSQGKLQRLLFVTSFYPFFLLYQWLHHIKRKLSGTAPETSMSRRYVYAVHGSFMIFRRAYFDAGGTLDFGSFLYGEELFVAEECRRTKQLLSFEPSLKMTHREHTTTGIYKNAAHMKWLHQSVRFIRDKYYEL